MRKFNRTDIAGLMLGFMLSIMAGIAGAAKFTSTDTSVSACTGDVTIEASGVVKCLTGGTTLLSACSGEVIIDSLGVIRCSTPLVPVCTLTAVPTSITAGGRSTLTVSCNPAATSYIWTGFSATASSASVSPTVTTTYSVQGVNAAGTGSSTSVVVTVGTATPPTCTLTNAPGSFVPGMTDTLTASCTPAATSYVWSANAGCSTSSASCPVAPTVTTAYSVTGSNSKGAGNTASTTVVKSAVTPTAPPTCTLTNAPGSFVPGMTDTLTVSCNPEATSYAWSANAGCPTSSASCPVAPTVTTAYSVSGSNSKGAGNTASTTVVKSAVCTLTASPTTIGKGETTTLSASCSPAATSYTWTSNPASFTSATAGGIDTPQSTTTYTVVGNTSTGPSAPVSVTVTVGTPVCSATASPLLPAADPLYVTTTLTASCDRAVSQYNWTAPAGPVAGANTATTIVTLPKTPLGTTTYYVNGQNGSGSGANAAVSVNVAVPSCSVAALPGTINPGGTSTLTASCTPAATSYSWTPATGLAAVANTATVTTTTSTAVGVYTYSVTGRNAVGDSASANGSVTVSAVVVPPASCRIVDVTWPAGLDMNPGGTPTQTTTYGQQTAFRVVMPQRGRTWSGVLYGSIPTQLSVSTNPCEWTDAQRAMGCATVGADPEIITSSSPTEPTSCQLTPGTTYYFNVKNAFFWNGSDTCAVGKTCTYKMAW